MVLRAAIGGAGEAGRVWALKCLAELFADIEKDFARGAAGFGGQVVLQPLVFQACAVTRLAGGGWRGFFGRGLA